MKNRSLLKLQNGSDVRGVAMEGVPGEKVNLTPEIARQIGAAFVILLGRHYDKPRTELKIAVGRDSRLTGPALSQAFIEGATSEGATVLDCGLSSTPAMFMSIIYPETDCDGAVMITASHLPFNRNGMKFFHEGGGFEREEIRQLLETAEASIIPFGISHNRNVRPFDLLSLYASKLCDTIRKEVNATNYEEPLKGLHIVVDAGNGNGGFFADRVLRPLGANISGSRFLDPDGHFPNHIPNPENRNAMKAICEATTGNRADLGLIFDTDVDRMSAVFADGKPVNRDAIIALIAAILAPDYPGATIVTDSVTSERLTAFLENTLGLKHLCYKRGYKNVINKCKELNRTGTVCPLAIETSGHGCLKENHYLDDGAYLAVKLLIAVAKQRSKGKTIDKLIEGLSQEFSAREVRFHILDEDFVSYGGEVIESVKTLALAKGFDVPPSYEGVRVRIPAGSLSPSFEGGWFVLRSSLHDPVMVLNMEGKTEADLFSITLEVRSLLTSAWKLDISSL